MKIEAENLNEPHKPQLNIGAVMRSVPCANCKENVAECACMRNKCIRCGNPVGNITFTVCDDCWDKDL